MPLRLVPFLLLVAAAPPDARLRALERGFVCPERLADDAARMKAARDFVQGYGAIRPGSHMGERLEARARLMRRHRCAPETLQHSFPED